jgi:hypothetical protein
MNSIARTRARVVAFLLAVALAASVFAPAAALAIPRTTALARAQSWVNKPVKYSQSRYHLGYRTDCSGYVSMCWDTKRSWSTATFHAVTHSIGVKDLRPGDAMLRPGYHVRLFHHWLNRSHTRYAAYESGYGKVAVVRTHRLSTDLRSGYTPTRYNEILETRPADDALWNGSFDAWSGKWGIGGEPVAWQLEGSEEQTLVAHRFNIARTGRDSLQLLAPAVEGTDTPTQISQAASVTAGAVYRARVWARTPGDPDALRLSLDFLGADGESIDQTATGGARFGVNDLGFRSMSLVATAPAGAVSAVMAVVLAAPAEGATIRSSAIIDDASLVRLRAAVSIKSSASSIRRSGRITLSGVVSPSNAIGTTATVYAQAPGRAWRKLGDSRITAADGAAVWHTSYYLSRGMRRGTYRFRVIVPAFPGYLGKTSGTVSVKLR